jgi:uncharacterized repeat protein (TIGR03806 family)
MRSAAHIGLALVVAAAACSHKDDAGGAAQPDAALSDECSADLQSQGKCDTLVGYGIFADAAAQTPAAGVVPYDVIAPLFADFAAKHRFLKLPAGAKMTYDPTALWTIPIGAIAVKTFAYPRDLRDPSKGERLVETRLVIRNADGFTPITYVWDEAQTRAVRTVAGADVAVAWTDATGATRTGTFGVPNTNQCLRCHGKTPTLLGVRTRQLNRDYAYGAGDAGIENQIDHMTSLGILDAPSAEAGARDTLVPPMDTTAPLDKRGRSYLEGNCGHCHNPNAAADWSGLYLNWEKSDGVGALGACKSPSSAGDTGALKYDLVPGDPDMSVIPYRMQLVGSAYRMPESSRVADTDGVNLIRAWIASMPSMTCP